MTPSVSFDPVAFKNETREEWRSIAEGWRKWYDVLEAEDAGQAISAKLVELTGIGPGASVLDVAGGYGEPSLTAARIVGPEGRVVCTDLSPEMLAFGKQRAAEAGADNVEFLERDAEQLGFDEATFDAVVSRAGLMFLPDVVGTLGRLHTFLKPGGRIAASVWGPLPKVQFLAGFSIVFQELQLPPPPPGRPGIVALSDADELAAHVKNAGFHDVDTGTIVSSFQTKTPEDFTQFMSDLAPRSIVELIDSQPQAVRERLRRDVTGVWKQFLDDSGRVRTTDEAIWVVGTK